MGTVLSVTILWRQDSGKEYAFAREKFLEIDLWLKNIAKAQKEEFPAAMKENWLPGKESSLDPY